MPFQPYPFQDSETRRKLEERRGKYGRQGKIEKGKGMGKVGMPEEGRRKKTKGSEGQRRGREVGNEKGEKGSWVGSTIAKVRVVQLADRGPHPARDTFQSGPRLPSRERCSPTCVLLSFLSIVCSK